MINIAICDDDNLHIEILENAVRKITDELGKNVEIDTYNSGDMLLKRIKGGKYYPLILLDVEMPKENGLDLCREIKIIGPSALVIFVSSHEKYVYESFKVQPYRFIPKLRLDFYLPGAIGDAINYIETLGEKNFCFSTRDGERIISYMEIMYIHRQGKYSYIECSIGEPVKVRKTLKEIYSELDDRQFVWLERGYICNLDKISQIKAGYAYMTNGDKLLIGRDRISEVKAGLRKYLIGRETRR